MKKLELIIDLSGPDGNIYALLGKTSSLMKKHRRITEFNELRDKVFSSQSYEEAVRYINDVVELIDISDECLLEKVLKRKVRK